jgi:hypothetical protein
MRCTDAAHWLAVPGDGNAQRCGASTGARTAARLIRRNAVPLASDRKGSDPPCSSWKAVPSILSQLIGQAETHVMTMVFQIFGISLRNF